MALTGLAVVIILSVTLDSFAAMDVDDDVKLAMGLAIVTGMLNGYVFFLVSAAKNGVDAENARRTKAASLWLRFAPPGVGLPDGDTSLIDLVTFLIDEARVPPTTVVADIKNMRRGDGLGATSADALDGLMSQRMREGSDPLKHLLISTSDPRTAGQGLEWVTSQRGNSR